MKLIMTGFEGVYIIENFSSKDERGSFIKTYHESYFHVNGLSTDFKESYYSISKKNVIRGMHFQLPPYDHDKLVYIAYGEVIDVILDMRKSSKTYGEVFSITLNDSNNRSIYIPRGFAHGFKVIEDDTIMIYNVSTIYNNKSDYGIRYDSIGFNWDVAIPILSERDKSLITFDDFKKNNPF